ncbi:hypothetical protein DXG01_004601 [Tephrocybe rancida]|nr:hypothetical protein DXG01_004601 [Tephrocybe rancida]
MVHHSKPYDQHNEEQVALWTSRVLQSFPDADPAWLRDFIKNKARKSGDNILETVLGDLNTAVFYPKAMPYLKGIVTQASKKCIVAYEEVSRPSPIGVDYFPLALAHLKLNFTTIPEDYLRNLLHSCNGLYAPTYLFLLNLKKERDEQRRQGRSVKLPYTPRLIPFRFGNPVQGRRLEDPEFQEESEWLVQHLATAEENLQPCKSSDVVVRHDDGSTKAIKEVCCQCCFSWVCETETISCSKEHVFCKRCIATHASNIIGAYKPDVGCPSTDDCKANLTTDELSQCLPEATMGLRERILQRRDIEAAGQAWATCPFCDWWSVENGKDDFHCENSACGVSVEPTNDKVEGTGGKCRLWDAYYEQDVEAAHNLEVAWAEAQAIEDINEGMLDYDRHNHLQVPRPQAVPQTQISLAMVGFMPQRVVAPVVHDDGRGDQYRLIQNQLALLERAEQALEQEYYALEHAYTALPRYPATRLVLAAFCEPAYQAYDTLETAKAQIEKIRMEVARLKLEGSVLYPERVPYQVPL